MVVALLSGCSTAPSTVSISYEHEGETRTATAHPETVDCDEAEASSLGIRDPQYSVRLHFGDDALGSYGSAWVYDERIVYFTTDELDVEHDGDRVRVSAAPGTVQLVEHAEDDGQPVRDFDVDGATEVDGSLTVDLVCSR